MKKGWLKTTTQQVMELVTGAENGDYQMPSFMITVRRRKRINRNQQRMNKRRKISVGLQGATTGIIIRNLSKKKWRKWPHKNKKSRLR